LQSPDDVLIQPKICSHRKKYVVCDWGLTYLYNRSVLHSKFTKEKKYYNIWTL